MRGPQGRSAGQPPRQQLRAIGALFRRRDQPLLGTVAAASCGHCGLHAREGKTAAGNGPVTTDGRDFPKSRGVRLWRTLGTRLGIRNRQRWARAGVRPEIVVASIAFPHCWLARHLARRPRSIVDEPEVPAGQTSRRERVLPTSQREATRRLPGIVCWRPAKSLRTGVLSSREKFRRSRIIGGRWGKRPTRRE